MWRAKTGKDMHATNQGRTTKSMAAASSQHRATTMLRCGDRQIEQQRGVPGAICARKTKVVEYVFAIELGNTGGGHLNR